MDVKVECERISILCHGCLTADRRLRLIDGEIRRMFYELRDDTNFVKQRCELLLCWECVAFLQKLKVFRARIKTAQTLLMQYLQCYYKNERICKPDSMSSLNIINRNTYNFEFYEEEKKEIDTPNGVELYKEENNTDDIPNDVELYKEKNKDDNLPNDVISRLKHKEKKNDLTSEDLLPGIEIKEEYNDSIKDEYNCSNDNDSDYYEEVIKFEQEESVDNSSNIKKNSDKKYKYKGYNIFAKVTKRTDVTKANHMQFAVPVTLDKREYEKILIRDNKRYGYRMPFKCKECRIGYFKKMDLQRHNSSWHSHKFPYKCAACPTEITSLEHQDQHWADAHSAMYKCTLCSEVYQSSFEVMKHIKLAHTKNYACKTCSLEYGSLRDFKNHYKTMHEKVVCDHCSKDFTKKRTLISHMKRHHIPAFCKICNRTYRNHKTFKYHNQVTHPELMAGETRKELSYCVECDKQYPSVFKYRRHLQQSPRHTQPKKIRVPCPDCGKIFTRTNFMRNHYRFVHLKVTKHYCDQCDKYYTTGYGLRKHIEKVHEKIAQPKDKICDLCGRGFGTNKILENHRRTHTGERPFKCKYCPAAFAQKTAMKTHQKSQHKNLEMSS